MINILIISLVSSCSHWDGSSADKQSVKYAGKNGSHIVSSGETLFSIAWRYGVDYKKLADFNNIKPPYIIYPTQKINLLKVSKGSIRPIKEVERLDKNTKRLKSTDSFGSKKRSFEPGFSSTTGQLSGPLIWQWPSFAKLTGRFQGESGFNKGIDLSGKLGEPVLAAASGRVVYSGSGLNGYGKLLIIKHNEIFLSAYAHNDELLVKEGDLIKAGQRIADMGLSGTDSVRLHFEIRSNGSPVDPLLYLPRRP